MTYPGPSRPRLDTPPGGQELPEDLLDLVVGGAGAPVPELLERLLREGIVAPPVPVIRT